MLDKTYLILVIIMIVLFVGAVAGVMIYDKVSNRPQKLTEEEKKQIEERQQKEEEQKKVQQKQTSNADAKKKAKKKIAKQSKKINR